ncbi:ZIP family metal transporter [Falsiroseomonas sp. HC035]|uniref:ZIP family metal transporter n=1 Tax=Falsiroseomonas sp. HC035 TaxID=3390999 RepID=UPI003D31F681
MAPDTNPAQALARPASPWRTAFWLLLPLAVLFGILALLILGKPLERLTEGSPPVEKVSFERVRLTPGLISVSIRADGSQPVTIAQVQVDAAFRTFAVDPPGPIDRLGTARIDIPYPWVDGEGHKVVLLSSTGAAFEREIEVARPTPTFDAPTLAILALVGILLGVAPVATGLLAFPALGTLSPAGMRFVLALTVGLLGYLFLDTLSEGLEQAAGALERLRAQAAVWVTMIISAGALMLLGRRGGRAPEGAALAAFIAFGIGLHNLGEGLAVGAAIAAGEAALATFLVVGFTIHNVSEGFGIAAPLVGRRPRLLTFVGLAALAGLPAVPGVWIGAQAVSPFWMAICFGIGAGAILQVIIEVTGLIVRREGSGALLSPAALGGVGAGLAVMYLTALFV